MEAVEHAPTICATLQVFLRFLSGSGTFDAGLAAG
jgi:hypothetical protein